MSGRGAPVAVSILRLPCRLARLRPLLFAGIALCATTHLWTCSHLSISPFTFCNYLPPSRIPDRCLVLKYGHLSIFFHSVRFSSCTGRTMSAPLPKSRFNLPDAIRPILAARGLSLADISRLSRVRFDGKRLFRIPPNFYEALRRASFSPSLHQLFALSVLTGYRLADWLGIFGISFDDIARFQAAWP